MEQQPSARQRRRLLKEILDRRDFLTAAGTLAAGVGLFGLTGCGSGGSDGTPTEPNPPAPPGEQGAPEGSRAISGSVKLPAGSTLRLTDLAVDAMTQTVPISATGGFTLGISPSGPSLGLCLDRGGTPVFVSMFDPSAASWEVSSHTTAVALLFYGVGGFNFPGSVQARILSLIAADPETSQLADVVAREVASNPHAIVDGAQPIGQRIVDSLTSMLDVPDAANERVPAVTGAAATAVPTLMTLQPSGEINGVMFSQDINTTSVLLSNVKRRPGRVYVYRMGTHPTDTANPIDLTVPATLVHGPIDMPSTERLELFSALKDFTTFFGGTSPWSPVDLPPIPLALDPPTADRTAYQVIVLTSSVKWVSGDFFEPRFFREQPFAAEVAKWRKDTEDLFLTTVFADMLMPVFCMLLGVGTIQVSRAILAQVAANAALVYRREGNRMLQYWLKASTSPQGVKAALAQTIEDALTDSLQLLKHQREVQKVVSVIDAHALNQQSIAAQGTRLSRAAAVFKKVFAPLFALEAVFVATDLGAVVKDFGESELGCSSVALLIRQKLNLRPVDPRVNSGDRVSFNVTNPANVTGSFQYDWTQTSLFAVLSAQGEVNVGRSITTTKRDVDLQTTGSDKDPILVTVIGYDISSGQRVEIGRAATHVFFLLPAEITPANPALFVGEQRIFVVTVGGQLPGGVQYRWTLSGNPAAGTIGSSNVVTTTIPQVTYRAVNSGSDVLQVEVLDASGVLLAKTATSVTVLGNPYVRFTIAGTWDPANQPPNGHYFFADHRGARTPAPDGSAMDWLAFGFDFAPNDNTVGVLVSVFLPRGAHLRTNQTFPKADTFQIGTWNLLLAQDLGSGIAGGNRHQKVPPGNGTLRFDAIGQRSDGSYVGHYTFSVTNNSGGTIIGDGIGKWTES